ncbi:MAG: bifunctional lysine ketoglutarate reductase /saccharopine dehydrogenase family protein [bacterium]
MTGKHIGIRREDKSELERRAPLTPNDVAELVRDHRIQVSIEPSDTRIFPDSAYREAGATLTDDLSDCDLIVGIKEVPVERLIDGKPHLFFSHTAKGQPYNMPLLASVLMKNVTLLDYELVTDEDGLRLIAFSYQAGQAGTINSLWALGQRLLAKGIDSPLTTLEQSIRYQGGLAEAKEAMHRVGDQIHKQGLPAAVSPLIIGITGEGRVAGGARDVLDVMNPVELTIEQLQDGEALAGLSGHEVYVVYFNMEYFLERIDGGDGFDFDEYTQHPERYRSNFSRYLPSLTVMVNGIYWDERFPKLVTLDDAKRLYTDDDPKLLVIGDITCDVGGSVETTVKATLPDNPVYVYLPETGQIRDGFEGEGLLMMTVDILPSEIPETSSVHFGAMLKPLLPALAEVDFSQPFDKLELPPAFRLSVIAHQGQLTPPFRYLLHHLSDE